ncbi:uncharacterized protein BDZ99DRAFT_534120 [Mytilinidion resinicola]|uniref:Uncharacterized protein n=1 Tax=Mytilinidion resinicola TaxID=574789 RepID=A0A6A6YJT8_9PEZI|nr:uncharacterized protein BDZ99DRAFT_534120 [Mytilinidion resinicola]KAF2808187.1 hypothetical protein BDZ99DRAFT_534120 [Mytilinidion resinicola]
MSDTTDVSAVCSSTTRTWPSSTSSENCWPVFDLSASDVDFLSLEFAKSKEIKDAIRRWKKQSSLSNSSKPSNQSDFLVLDEIFSSLCIAETSVMGNPIKVYSEAFRLGPRGLRVGDCMFLNRPSLGGEEFSLETMLRDHVRPGFVLEWCTELLQANKSGSALLLCSQLDITESFQSLAVQKATRRTGAPIVGGSERVAPSFAEFDWLNFVNERYGTDSNNIPEAPARTDIVTGAGSLDIDVAIFSNKVKEVYSCYRDCFVLVEDPLAPPEIAWPALDRIGIRAVAYFSPKSLQSSQESLSFTLSDLANEIAEDIKLGIAGQKDFQVSLFWSERKVPKRLYFVHMSDGRTATRAQRAWACFPADIQTSPRR